jgi:hypothetical protein
MDPIIIPAVEPTICGPVSDFQGLTTTANAYTLGWYGFIAGALAAAGIYVAVVHVAPFVYWLGREKGWWR